MPPRHDDAVETSRGPGLAPEHPRTNLVDAETAVPPPISWHQLSSTKVNAKDWGQALACSKFDDIWHDLETSSAQRISMSAGAMPGGPRLLDAICHTHGGTFPDPDGNPVVRSKNLPRVGRRR